MAKVFKTTAELYQIRHETLESWGDIFLICGKESVGVSVNSDYGNFGFDVSICGCEPKEFLTRISFDSCMNKLTEYKLYVPAPEQYPVEVKKCIIESRRNKALTKEEAREAWDDMLDTEHKEGDLYFMELMEHHLFNKVFGEYEHLPSAKKVDPRCQDFWDHVWVPFVAELKEELKASKAA
ncbi:TPA: hypothetical protein JFP82_002139 [Vibrio cholerae O1]|uniref:Phage protein n=1 Tax=Vibrio cholerae TaxID=666 RepID=A0ABD7SQU4_VIBCL|nr:hypothetical protein [Vibrio cholerae]TXX67197.1 hypothetical protein FXF03_01100 [Vibrio cholerae]GIA99652.1 hypothetical protein VCSRO136_2394 [Vibrio cholerae]HAS7809030.1 hypothetical protein [Vibrio cholerae]HAU9839335.1 hypothetical protein [Vibrio cholerae O1]